VLFGKPLGEPRRTRTCDPLIRSEVARPGLSTASRLGGLDGCRQPPPAPIDATSCPYRDCRARFRRAMGRRRWHQPGHCIRERGGAAMFATDRSSSESKGRKPAGLRAALATRKHRCLCTPPGVAPILADRAGAPGRGLFRRLRGHSASRGPVAGGPEAPRRPAGRGGAAAGGAGDAGARRWRPAADAREAPRGRGARGRAGAGGGRGRDARWPRLG
jgi:hypothetical protein